MLINCAAYCEGRKLCDLNIEQISDFVRRPETFVWVAIKDPSDAELAVMREEFGLHKLAVEDALKGHQRPKIEEYGDSLFVVLHTVELSANQEIRTGEIHIFVGRNYILSVRNKTEQGFSHIRKRCEGEPELLKHGSVYVLYALMDTVVDRYFPIVDELEQRLEKIEEHLFSELTSAQLNTQELYTLKRQLMVVFHAVAPLLDVLGRLHGGRVPQLCQGMQDYFRDIYDHAIRITKSLESLREMTTTAIQVNLSLISLGESEVTKKLASYGALFAIPTAIAGIYGMNFRYMPELQWPFGYPLILFFIVILEILLWWRFRKARWL